jgi:uroporphyrinogen decarboxylase
MAGPVDQPADRIPLQEPNCMNHLERFVANMEYAPCDRVPNWEMGVWPQTRERWEAEGVPATSFHWDWFSGEERLGMDPREFIRFVGSMLPAFEEETLYEDERTVTYRDSKGRLRRALKEGSIGSGRLSMDQYIDFPVKEMSDWLRLKSRYDPTSPQRHEPNWRETRVTGWRAREHPLIFGPNCSTLGFYWLSRDLLGTENLSYAWYDQPEMMHDIMETWADFIIASARPVLEHTTVEYVCFNEDMAMKTGPLLSPQTHRTFIYPRFKRVVEFLKGHGVRYVAVDTDGNPEALILALMDAGVDILWPLERAADQDPLRLRQTYGRSLRLWGGVDKRALAQGPAATDAHLRMLRPLIEEGGYIPMVDHTVPPDVSWPNFQHYMESKDKLLRGEL